MNLRLKDIGPCPKRSTRNLDRWGTISVVFEKSDRVPSKYWRFVNDTMNLIEVEIERQFGILESIALVQFNGEIEVRPSPHHAENDLKYLDGLPAFDLDLWENREDLSEIARDYYDESGTCRIFWDYQDLHILLRENEPLGLRLAVDPDLHLDFNDQNELNGIWLKDLSDAEKTNLINIFRFNQGV